MRLVTGLAALSQTLWLDFMGREGSGEKERNDEGVMGKGVHGTKTEEKRR